MEGVQSEGLSNHPSSINQSIKHLTFNNLNGWSVEVDGVKRDDVCEQREIDFVMIHCATCEMY